MADLRVNYKNIEFQNPFILASAPPTRNAQMIARAFEAGWAGAVTKTICHNYKEMDGLSPRIHGYKINNSVAGLQNIELISNRSPQEWAEDIKYLKQNYPKKIVIASISAEAENYADWQTLAVMMQKAGADILELNISCPHGLPEKSMGAACSTVDYYPVMITEAVKAVAKIPIWIKLSSAHNDINNLARLCLDAGIDGFCAVNTVKGFSGIDIETGSPHFSIDGKSTFGGFSGSIIKPVGLMCVSQIAKNSKCFISASGGINSWQDGVEYLLLGASTLQVCTKVMLEGYDTINSLLTGLSDYMEKHNFNSLSEIIGKSLKNIKKFEDLNQESKFLPEIDINTCVKCGKCYISCRDAGYQAINYSEINIPEINLNKCAGCGLCAVVCPINCIQANLSVLQENNSFSFNP